MADHLVLGHALITMVEPDKATVADYNRWYERDHFLSGVLTGPGAFAGRRWLATRSLKAVRFPADSPIAQPVDDGSFIALYWIEAGRLDAHCSWGFPEAARLAGLGRMRSDRHHVSTAYYDLVAAHGRGEQPVVPELALHHPYAGLVMVWTERNGAEAADTGRHDAWAAQFRSALTADGSPVGQVVTLRPIELADPLPKMPGVIIGGDATRDVLAHCCFVDADLRSVWRDVSQLLHRQLAAATGTGVAVLLAAPFIPSITGTDAHLDELW